MARPPEIGPVCVRASSTLLNGSEERIDEEATSHARSRSSASSGRPTGCWARGRSCRRWCKALEVSEATYHRWRAQYGGMKADDVKRLKELERRERAVEADRGRSDAGYRGVEGDEPKGNW